MRSVGITYDHGKNENLKEKYLKDYKAFKSRRKPFSKDEDQEIINWILKYESFNLLRGNTIWKIMESKVCQNKRPWQSLQDRFHQSIVPNIESYNLPVKIVKKFRRVKEDVGSSLSSEQKESHGESEESVARLERKTVKNRQFHKKRNSERRETASSSEEEKKRKEGRRRRKQDQDQEIREDGAESWCEADQSDQKSDKEDTESRSSTAEQQEHPTVIREAPAPNLNLLVEVPEVDINSDREIEDVRRLGSEEKDKTVPGITAVPVKDGPGTNKSTNTVEEEGQASNSSSGKFQVSSDSEEFSSLSDSNPPLVESTLATPGSPQDSGEGGARSVGDGKEESGEESEEREEVERQREAEEDQNRSKTVDNRPEDSRRENLLEMFQVPSDSSVNNLSRQDVTSPLVENVVGTPDWQHAVTSTFRQPEEESEELPRSVGDGQEESEELPRSVGDGQEESEDDGGSGGSQAEGPEEEEEGEESDQSLKLAPVVPVLRTPKKRRRKTVAI